MVYPKRPIHQQRSRENDNHCKEPTCFAGGEYHAQVVPSSGYVVALGIA